MFKELIVIFLYVYLFSMISILIYYLYAHWFAIIIARKYHIELTMFDISTKGLLVMICPLVNTIVAIILWLQIDEIKKAIKRMIILSAYPDLEDSLEDKDTQ